MCPMCLTALAVTVAKATGVSATTLVVAKRIKKSIADKRGAR